MVQLSHDYWKNHSSDYMDLCLLWLQSLSAVILEPRKIKYLISRGRRNFMLRSPKSSGDAELGKGQGGEMVSDHHSFKVTVCDGSRHAMGSQG